MFSVFFQIIILVTNTIKYCNNYLRIFWGVFQATSIYQGCGSDKKLKIKENRKRARKL